MDALANDAEEAMTKKPHDVDTGDDQELTLEEMDAISGGVLFGSNASSSRGDVCP